MTFFVPWIAIMVLAPVAGAIVARAIPARQRRVVLVVNLLVLAASAGALIERGARGARGAWLDPLDPGPMFGARAVFVLDELNATLFVFAATVALFVAVVAPMRKWSEGSAARMMLAEAFIAGGFASATDIGLAAFFVLSFLPLDLELGAFPNAARVRPSFRINALIAASLFVAGVALARSASAFGAGLILAAAMVRQGVAPFQSWLPHLFARAPLPAVLMFAVPQWGTFAALRLVVPAAPVVMGSVLAVATAATCVYGAGIALVQTDARRAFGWLFVSETAIVFASLAGASETGLAGGLLLFLSSGLALAGLGMTLAALEARRGRVTLARYSGGYENTPRLAAGFLLLGLCSVGFPGTLGFVGTELLVADAVTTRPGLGMAIVVATVLNGLAVVRMYFRLFCGERVPVNPRLALRRREDLGFMALVFALALLGLWPQPILASRVKAAHVVRSPDDPAPAFRLSSLGERAPRRRAGPVRAANPDVLTNWRSTPQQPE
ncbi:hypothetical protein K8I61_10185 [bacterium]|nr:hypothetical protein [bacterium]